MKPLNNAGFTIVETTLFLGISGLLAVGVLATVGGSINVQRYHDSVTSLRSTLQQQYSDVANVSNDRPGAGQSDQFILGKYITTTDDSNTLSVRTVVGTKPDVTADTGDDLAAIESYKIGVLPGSGTSYNVEWGASVKALGGSDLRLSMLIIRSPLSGTVLTFIDNRTSPPIDGSKLNDLINQDDALSTSATICVDSGLLFSTKMAVIVSADATGPSGIQMNGETSEC